MAESKFKAADTCLTSFDGSTRIATHAKKPDRYQFWDDRTDRSPRIARGGGYSYVAASFSESALTVDHGSFDRILDFDARTGIIEVESGITLGAIYEFLLPRGRCLAVQPGYPAITVGGCIGADVHGKNQFLDGTFIDQVESLKLFHRAHGILELSRDRDGDLFRLTCGGYGLTGEILTARLRTKTVPSSWVRIETVRIADLYGLGAGFDAASEGAELLYSWHDLTRKGEGFGRGFIKKGCFESVAVSQSSQPGTQEPLPHPALRIVTAQNRGHWRYGFFGKWSARALNMGFYQANLLSGAPKRVPIYDFIFPVHDKQSYFKLFGTRGFHEYQVILPKAKFQEFGRAIQDWLAKHPVGITLASGKLFRGKSDYLRFTGDGICFAFNYPRNAQSWEMGRFLDEQTLRAGGIPNLIKDSRLSAAVVSQAYGEGYERFKHELLKFDPQRIYRSELSERLGL